MRWFVLICIGRDAPTRTDDVSKSVLRVSASLKRTECVPWLMVEILPKCRELGGGGGGVIARGKRAPIDPPGSQHRINDYTDWFASDPAMAGQNGGYDGLCPPWNDELVQHSHLRIHALDVATFGLAARFAFADVRVTIRGHHGSPAWNAFFFYRHGVRNDANASRCSRTMTALDAAPLCRVRAYAPEVCFSVLTSGSHIQPHHRVTNTRVVTHLALVVPDDCALVVGGESHTWQEGPVSPSTTLSSTRRTTAARTRVWSCCWTRGIRI